MYKKIFVIKNSWGSFAFTRDQDNDLLYQQIGSCADKNLFDDDEWHLTEEKWEDAVSDDLQKDMIKICTIANQNI